MRLWRQMQCLSEILISQCQKYLCVAFDKEAGGASPSPTMYNDFQKPNTRFLFVGEAINLPFSLQKSGSIPSFHTMTYKR